MGSVMSHGGGRPVLVGTVALDFLHDGPLGAGLPPVRLPALPAEYPQHSRGVLPAFRITGTAHPLPKVPGPRYSVKEC